MTQGEFLISILLAIIAWLLYQILRQLSYLTGRRFKFSLPGWQHFTSSIPSGKHKKKPPEHLPN